MVSNGVKGDGSLWHLMTKAPGLPPDALIHIISFLKGVKKEPSPLMPLIQFLIGFITAQQTDLVLEHCKLLEQVMYGALIIIGHRLLDIE